MAKGAKTLPDASTEAPSRAMRRRVIMRSLLPKSKGKKDLRDDLVHFEREMADQFAKNRLTSSIVIPALILVMGFALGFIVEPIIAVTWGAAMMLIHGLVIQACRRFLTDPNARTNFYRWKQRFIIRDLLYGICWATFPILFLPEIRAEFPSTFITEAHQESIAAMDIMRFAAVIVVMSVGTLLSSPIPAAAVASTLPIALSMAAVHIIQPDILNVIIALCTMGAEIFFLYLSSHLHYQHSRNLAFRAEKDALFAELEQSNAVSDEARRRAEAANMAKSQFLATMSHELRTPLNAILGFSEVMRNEMLGPIENASYKDYLGDIHASGQHLLKLINEILDLSRIEAGKRELKEELVDLVAIATEARGLLNLKARQKQIEIAEVYDDKLPKIILDEQAIRQVILNLVSNAIKFTPVGGEIVVKVGKTQSGGQYISVRDNGPGIPEDEIPVVLSAFGQGSVSIKNAEQGTGLGIPIVQALIHLHGGNFTLRSQLNIGTEAIATLPAKRVVSPFNDEYGAWGGEEHDDPRIIRRAS